MFLNRLFRQEWFNRFPWFSAYLINNGWTLRKCRLSPICRGILAQSFSCKKLSNQKYTANTVRNTRRTTLCWMRGKIKSFYLSNLLCICPALFETYLNKANCIIYEKLFRVFSVAETLINRCYLILPRIQHKVVLLVLRTVFAIGFWLLNF